MSRNPLDHPCSLGVLVNVLVWASDHFRLAEVTLDEIVLCLYVPLYSMYSTSAYCKVRTGRKRFNGSDEREECRNSTTCCDGRTWPVGGKQVEQNRECRRQDGAFVAGAQL